MTFHLLRRFSAFLTNPILQKVTFEFENGGGPSIQESIPSASATSIPAIVKEEPQETKLPPASTAENPFEILESDREEVIQQATSIKRKMTGEHGVDHSLGIVNA